MKYWVNSLVALAAASGISSASLFLAQHLSCSAILPGLAPSSSSSRCVPVDGPWPFSGGMCSCLCCAALLLPVSPFRTSQTAHPSLPCLQFWLENPGGMKVAPWSCVFSGGGSLLLLVGVRWAPWSRCFREGGTIHLVLPSAHGSSVPMGTPSLPPTQPCSSLAGVKRNILFSWNTICSQIMYKTFAETTYSSCIFYESNLKLKYINIKISRSTLGEKKKKVIS